MVRVRGATMTPKSQRWREKDADDQGHPEPPMSTENLMLHISMTTTCPAQQRNEGGARWSTANDQWGAAEGKFLPYPP